MMNGILGFLGAVNPILSLAKEAVNLVENANDASNPNQSPEFKKNARQNCIDHALNIGAPIGAAVAAGVATKGVGALPAGIATQEIMKATGIGKVLGGLFQPVLIPFAKLGAFFKKKVNKHLGLDLNQWISQAVNMVKPILGISETISRSIPSTQPNNHSVDSALGLMNIFTEGASLFKGAKNLVTGLLGGLASMFEKPRPKAIINTVIRKMNKVKTPTPSPTLKKRFA